LAAEGPELLSPVLAARAPASGSKAGSAANSATTKPTANILRSFLISLS
jgi:hypothetical protein